MKKIYLTIRVFACLCCMLPASQTIAQCGAGYSQAQLNWDNLDFLPTGNANYTPSYISGITPYSQNFAIGTRRINFAMAPASNITFSGENFTNTGDVGSWATPGSDVQFVTTSNANTTITMSVDTNVTNIRFSIFDLDNDQRVVIRATNLLGVTQNVLTARASGGSAIALSGPATAPIANGPAFNYADNDNRGTLNVTVAGPASTIVLTFDKTVGDVWLSDINACVTRTFPVGYRAISQPFTNQPAYILTVVDSIFMMVNPATGRSKVLFHDPGHSNMNGMAYDPYNRILYYTYSLTSSPSATKTIYRYNINTETKSTLIADINAAPLNIPTYDPGVTSGSASFYNGSLYFGVEASNSSRTSGRENTVWRIEFDGALNPLRSSQVYASKVDSNISGSDRLIHDWSDIGVTNNGTLYDFDGAGVGTSNQDSMYYHFNMMTGQRTQFAPNGVGNIGPKQTAIDWQENVYNMGGLPTRSSNAQTIGGFIVPYSYNGAVNNAQNRLITLWPGGTTPIGSWGDCSEAFRPLCDFGDAPASYDPVALSPAVNERDTALRIGATFDREWLKTSSALANADGSDEDGITTVPIFNNTYSIYGTQVNVYNNTGANATLIGWFDWNGNGVFNTGEASNVITVTSSSSMQNRVLSWTGIASPLPSGSFTYMRIRMTSSANLMTTSNATGWFDNGETEDYRVVVSNSILPVSLISFDAKTVNNSKVMLNWSASEDNNFSGYEVERSQNGSNWEFVSFVPGSSAGGTHQYELTDNAPYKGTSYYRLKLKESDGQSRYSEVRVVKINDLGAMVTVSPNPAMYKATVTITNLVEDDQAHIQVIDARGNQLSYQKIKLLAGINSVELPVTSLPSGSYIVIVSMAEGTVHKKLIIRK